MGNCFKGGGFTKVKFSDRGRKLQKSKMQCIYLREGATLCHRALVAKRNPLPRARIFSAEI
jgi:hypothetical protein